MDKTTTLHIGTTKTGSTSIQSFLARNRAVLADNSVLYPRSLGAINHNAIPVYLDGKQIKSQIQTKFNIKTVADYAQFATNRPSQLMAEIQDHDPAHIIISSEHMHSRCFTNTHFSNLKKLLDTAIMGRKLRIVVYLRSQISHVLSLYSTMLRHGNTDTIDDFISNRMSGRRRRYFDYQALLKNWAAAFPQATIIVRPFASLDSLPHGTLSDFLEIEHLTRLSDQLQFEPRQNKGMGAWSAEALRQLNALTPPLPAHLEQSTRKWLRHGTPLTGKVIPDINIARAFQASFTKGNAWVSRTYFGGDRTTFDVDWTKYQAPPAETGVSPQHLFILLRDIANNS